MLAMEVYHTHSTGDKKVGSSAILGVQIAEFDADAILNLNKGGWLDNKRDASWICSQKCKHQQDMELKRLAEARLCQARKQELLKRQQAMEERRQAQQQEEFMRQCETLYQIQRQEKMKQQEISSTAPVQAIQQDRWCSKPWNRPYAIVNDGRSLSYGHAFKPELTLYNHPPPPSDAKFDYSVPVMGQPSDYVFCHQLNTLVKLKNADGSMIPGALDLVQAAGHTLA